MRKQITFKTILIAVFLLVVIIMIAQLIPLLIDVINNRDDESSIVGTVDALGWRGPVALAGLTALQVIFPLVPAAAIGVLIGLTYGVYWGVLIFLGGISLGNLFVVLAIRQVDAFLAGRKKHKEKHHNGPLSKEKLENINKPEIVAFFLFMIPFISGAGPYLFAETKVKLWKYIIAVAAGSIPTTIIYVFLGYHISQGSYTIAIIIASIFIAAMILIIVFKNKILNMIMGGG